MDILWTDTDESSEEEKEHKERRVQLKHENSDSEEPSKKSKVLSTKSKNLSNFHFRRKKKRKRRRKRSEKQRNHASTLTIPTISDKFIFYVQKQQNCPLLVIFVQKFLRKIRIFPEKISSFQNFRTKNWRIIVFLSIDGSKKV